MLCAPAAAISNPRLAVSLPLTADILSPAGRSSSVTSERGSVGSSRRVRDKWSMRSRNEETGYTMNVPGQRRFFGVIFRYESGGKAVCGGLDEDRQYAAHFPHASLQDNSPRKIFPSYSNSRSPAAER